MNRWLGSVLIAVSVASAAMAADYVSPHSWFGFPGTMINDAKTFTVWWPEKPLPEKTTENHEQTLKTRCSPRAMPMRFRELAMKRFSDVRTGIRKPRKKSVLLADAAPLDSRAQLNRIANAASAKDPVRGFMY
jgi:hypothetical protein